MKVSNGLDLQGQKVVNVGDPSTNTDGANKQYVDNAIRGMKWKDSARAASTANVTLSSPGASIDGVTLNANDRVLLKNQTTGSENGIYVWTASGSPLTRATDADSAAELVGAAISVTEGSTNADKLFLQTADNITLGTTALSFTQVGAAGASYTAGTGLTLSSNQFAIDTTVVTRKFAATVGDGSATSIAVTHNLGTQDITYSVRATADNSFYLVDGVATSTNVLTLTFATAPASGAYRVVVHA